jgi:2',3'-cyclic-nucleotide 2'-phosphodiesterase (5'-nucleotidase family)
VFPYNNQVVTVEITGQVLLDMLEMCVSLYPEEQGCFPSMSGVTFSLDASIPTSVTLDENGFFTGVDGEYRVYGVRVLDQESGEYRDLDLAKKYVLAGTNYHLLSQGDGLAMFRDARLIDAEGTLDIEVVEGYITDYLGGVIGEEYAEPQGRITFTEGRS